MPRPSSQCEISYFRARTRCAHPIFTTPSLLSATNAIHHDGMVTIPLNPVMYSHTRNLESGGDYFPRGLAVQITTNAPLAFCDLGLVCQVTTLVRLPVPETLCLHLRAHLFSDRASIFGANMALPCSSKSPSSQGHIKLCDIESPIL